MSDEATKITRSGGAFRWHIVAPDGRSYCGRTVKPEDVIELGAQWPEPGGCPVCMALQRRPPRPPKPRPQPRT